MPPPGLDTPNIMDLLQAVQSLSTGSMQPTGNPEMGMAQPSDKTVPYYLANPTSAAPAGIPGAGNLPGVDPNDQNARAVQSFLRTLNAIPKPEPPHVSIGKRIMGAIGDALGNMAAVRSGGQPHPGPFLSTMTAQNQKYQEDLRDWGRQNTDLSNAVRIKAFESQLAQTREEAVARVKGQNQRLTKSEWLAPVNGEIHRIRQFSNPATGEIVPTPDEDGQMRTTHDLGPAPQGFTYQPDINGHIIQLPTSGAPQGAPPSQQIGVPGAEKPRPPAPEPTHAQGPAATGPLPTGGAIPPPQPKKVKTKPNTMIGVDTGQLAKQPDDKPVIRDTPNGPIWVDPKNPTAPGRPVLDQNLEPVEGKQNLQAAQSMSVLRNLKANFDALKTLYRAGHGYQIDAAGQMVPLSGPPAPITFVGADGSPMIIQPHVDSKWGGYAMGEGAKHELTRDLMSQFDSATNATTHELIRATILPEMARPLSGASRGIAAMLEQLKLGVGSYATAPQTAEPSFALFDNLIAQSQQELDQHFRSQTSGTTRPLVTQVGGQAPGRPGQGLGRNDRSNNSTPGVNTVNDMRKDNPGQQGGSAKGLTLPLSRFNDIKDAGKRAKAIQDFEAEGGTIDRSR